MIRIMRDNIWNKLKRTSNVEFAMDGRVRVQLVSIDGDENVGREKPNHFTKISKRFMKTKCLLLIVNLQIGVWLLMDCTLLT